MTDRVGLPLGLAAAMLIASVSTLLPSPPGRTPPGPPEPCPPGYALGTFPGGPLCCAFDEGRALECRSPASDSPDREEVRWSRGIDAHVRWVQGGATLCAAELHEGRARHTAGKSPLCRERLQALAETLDRARTP